MLLVDCVLLFCAPLCSVVFCSVLFCSEFEVTQNPGDFWMALLYVRHFARFGSARFGYVCPRPMGAERRKLRPPKRRAPKSFEPAGADLFAPSCPVLSAQSCLSVPMFVCLPRLSVLSAMSVLCVLSGKR